MLCLSENVGISEISRNPIKFTNFLEDLLEFSPRNQILIDHWHNEFLTELGDVSVQGCCIETITEIVNFWGVIEANYCNSLQMPDAILDSKPFLDAICQCDLARLYGFLKKNYESWSIFSMNQRNSFRGFWGTKIIRIYISTYRVVSLAIEQRKIPFQSPRKIFSIREKVVPLSWEDCNNTA